VNYNKKHFAEYKKKGDRNETWKRNNDGKGFVYQKTNKQFTKEYFKRLLYEPAKIRQIANTVHEGY
jgi:hypothetical protein